MSGVTRRAVWRTGRVDVFDAETETWVPGQFGPHTETFDMDVDTGDARSLDVGARVGVRPFVCDGEPFEAHDAPNSVVDVAVRAWRPVDAKDLASMAKGPMHVRIDVTLTDPDAAMASCVPVDGYVAEFEVSVGWHDGGNVD